MSEWSEWLIESGADFKRRQWDEKGNTSNEWVIKFVANFDDEIKEQLQEFCKQVIHLDGLIDKMAILDIQMSWRERKFSWLPFVRKDRHKEYQKYKKENLVLRQSITGIYDLTCHKLDFLIARLEEAAKDAGSEEKEAVAVIAVLEAFKGFYQKFRYYNWFLRFGKNESEVSFRNRYPDARRIYQNILSDGAVKQ